MESGEPDNHWSQGRLMPENTSQSRQGILSPTPPNLLLMNWSESGCRTSLKTSVKTWVPTVGTRLLIPVREVPNTTHHTEWPKRKGKTGRKSQGANIIHFVDVHRARKGLGNAWRDQHHQPTIAPQSLLVTLSCYVFYCNYYSHVLAILFLPTPLECKLLERKEGFLSLQNYIFTWSAGILWNRVENMTCALHSQNPCGVRRTSAGRGQW